MGTLWHDKRFDWLRNSPAILKCVVFVKTSPGLPMGLYLALSCLVWVSFCMASSYSALCAVRLTGEVENDSVRLRLYAFTMCISVLS